MRPRPAADVNDAVMPPGCHLKKRRDGLNRSLLLLPRHGLMTGWKKLKLVRHRQAHVRGCSLDKPC